MVEIKCPPRDIDVQSRKEILFNTIKNYINSDEFKELVLLFGGIDYSNMSFKEQIDYLSEFVKVWDYRNNRERWAISNDEFINNNKDRIRELLVRLNMVNTRNLEKIPDYILVLGGARYSNFDRPFKAKTVYDSCENKPTVIGLTCDRPISEVERDAYLEYGDDIKTEADALGKGIEESFHVSEVGRKDNIVEYDGNIYTISARSNTEGYRANTYDTFMEFISVYNVKDKNILLVTNQPYTSYQLLKFMDFAFTNNLFIEAVGCDGRSTLQESNYLQELKSNVDAFKVLCERYLVEDNYER